MSLQLFDGLSQTQPQPFLCCFFVGYLLERRGQSPVVVFGHKRQIAVDGRLGHAFAAVFAHKFSVSKRDVQMYRIGRLYCGGFYCSCLLKLRLCAAESSPSMVVKHSGLELAKRGICVSSAVYHLKVLLLDAGRVIMQGLVGPSLTLPSCSVSSSLPDADGSPALRTHLQIKWQI